MSDTHTYLDSQERESTSTADAPDEWLSIGEAAALLGLSVTTLRRYDDSGRLKAHRSPGGQRRYKRADVRAVLTPAA